jgi:hypothetical protein
MKFPPTQFYIEQIKKLSEFFNNAPLHICIFTSDSNPEELKETIERNVGKKNILFSIVSSYWDAHVVEDCYLISLFDCLIKSVSTFSSISQLMKNNAITIMPNDYFWDQEKLVIHKSLWLIRKEKLRNLY